MMAESSGAALRSPEALIDVVAAYSDFGNHHTASEADESTAQWLARLLEGLGAVVERRPFTFDRFHVSTELRTTVDSEGGRGTAGDLVPSVPLFYSAVGSFETSDFEVVALDRRVVGSPRRVEHELVAAPGQGAVVFATDGPPDLPVQCNRAPVVSGVRPAVVIADNWADRVQAGAKLRFDASVAPATGANLVATVGPADAPKVTIATPLSGWTPCAGERGTGLAVALALTADLAQDHHVSFVAASGHELDHIGLQDHLSQIDANGDTVIHLGASVGSVQWSPEGTATLDRRRMVLTTASSAKLRTQIGSLVAEANWTLTDLDPWPGEGGNWRRAGASVLSFLGSSELFHTMGDVTARATTPEAMVLACDTAIAVTRVFLGGGKPKR